MSAILGTFVSMKTMADGGVRITLDLQCKLAEFAAMGTDPGTPFGLARITQGASQQLARKEAISEEEKPKGGPLAKLAGMWCNDPEFLAWLRITFVGLSLSPSPWLPDQAAEYIRQVCNVGSRAELDSNPRARTLFDQKFRVPYMNYLEQSKVPDSGGFGDSNGESA